MTTMKRRIVTLPLAAIALALLGAGFAHSLSAQSPYHAVIGWGQLPDGMKWGEVPNLAVNSKGVIFAFRRAEPPVIELNADGKVVKTWGQGQYVWPHGMRFDRDGNLWLTDGRA